MNNEVAVRASVEAEISGFEMKPRTLEDAMKFCEIMADSDLVPSGYKNKPGNIMVAIQMGSEIGMTPMRALRSIAVINGRASMWGDDMLAMVLASPVCEYVNEKDSTEKEGICRTKRKGCVEQVSRFTLEDAKRAGLLGKAGSWQTHTGRMLKLRARGFGLRDTFADVLAGLVSVEEALDIPPSVETFVNPPETVTLKDKLRAKVETTEPPVVQGDRQEDGAGDGGDGHVAPSQSPQVTAQQASDAQTPTHLDADRAIEQQDVRGEYVKRFQAVQGAAANPIYKEVQQDGRLTQESKDSLYKTYTTALKTRTVK